MPAVVGTRGHLRRQDVFGADLAAVAELLQFLGGQHGLQLGGRFAGLRAVRLVGDHREAFALGRGQLPHLLQGKGKRLDRADDDLLGRRRAPSASSPLLLLLSPLIVATTPVVRSKSKIASCNCVSITLRSDTTSTESNSFLCSRVVQVGQEVGRPGDRVGLARARRMLDQVLAARPFVSTAAWSLRVASS